MLVEGAFYWIYCPKKRRKQRNMEKGEKKRREGGRYKNQIEMKKRKETKTN